MAAAPQLGRIVAPGKPCTALSVVKILEHLNVYDSALPIGHRMHGKVVTVINRSEIVGRPLAAMLANDGATVYSVDINSIYVFKQGRLIPAEDGTTPEDCVRRADIIVTGVRALDLHRKTAACDERTR
eukprot:SAG31_NODE_1427_length_8392_cov_5.283613_3_plen_128_part_00